MGMHALPLIRTTTNSFLCGSLKNSSKSLVRRVINTTSNKQQHKQSRINTTATAAMEKHDFDYDILNNMLWMLLIIMKMLLVRRSCDEHVSY